MTARPMTRSLAGFLTVMVSGVTFGLAACGDDEPDAATAPSDSTSARQPTDPAPTTTASPDPTTSETEASMTTEPDAPRPTPPGTLPAASTPPATTDGAGGSRPASDDTTASAIDDLAGRIGVAPDAITVVSDERVTWRDGSIGCPRPGMSYTQALLPGRRLILSSGGQTYAYHAARTGPLAYCATPAPDATAPDGAGTST